MLFPIHIVQSVNGDGVSQIILWNHVQFGEVPAVDALDDQAQSLPMTAQFLRPKLSHSDEHLREILYRVRRVVQANSEVRPSITNSLHKRLVEVGGRNVV